MKPIIWGKTILAAGIFALAAPAFGDETASTNSSPMQQAVTPQDFAWDAAVANLKEIRLGQAAEQNSQNADVKEFGKHMVRDHSAANKMLAKIAMAEGLNLPDTNVFYVTVTVPDNEKPATELMAPLTPDARLKVEQLAAQHLESLSGGEFDQAYAAEAVKDHAAAVQLFETASASLTDKDLKKFDDKMLPKLRKHYQMAQDLQNKVSPMPATPVASANSDTNLPPIQTNPGAIP